MGRTDRHPPKVSCGPTREGRLGPSALLFLLQATGAASASPADDEALYRQRFEATMRDRGVFTQYAPLEHVPGATCVDPLPVATDSTRSIRGDALEAAAAYAEANRSSAIIVWRDGKVQLERYFGATSAATLLVSKSLSKPLTAIAVGRAIELGKIESLDQLLVDYIPEWAGTPKATMQVRHLLDMRSGLLDQSFSPDPESPLNRAYLDPNHGEYIVRHYPLTHPPGTRYGYNNATSELVALLIERTTGMRYAQFIGREVLGPIGAPGGEIWIDRPGGLAHSGCCMRLPAQSWLRLAILLLDDGVAGGRRLLPRGYVSEMRRGTPQNPHYGLGVWVAGPYTERRGFGAPDAPGPKVLHGEPYLDRDLFLFDGNSNQTVYMSPATRMVILRTGDTPPQSPEWDNTKLPNLLIKAVVPGPREATPIPQPR